MQSIRKGELKAKSFPYPEHGLCKQVELLQPEMKAAFFVTVCILQQ